MQDQHISVSRYWIQSECFHEWTEPQDRAACVCCKCRYTITKLEMAQGARLPVKGILRSDML